jgi:hypothetical protein
MASSPESWDDFPMLAGRQKAKSTYCIDPKLWLTSSLS